MSFFASRAAEGIEHLVNGGFEEGTDGWSAGQAFSTSSLNCSPRTGSAAGSLTASAGQPAPTLQQTVLGSFAAGSYSLAGYARIASGTPVPVVALIWFNASGAELDRVEANLSPSESWSAFPITQSSAPTGAVRLVVRVTTNSPPSELCLDDLSLAGPAFATATPPPSPTPQPTELPPTATLPPPTATTIPPGPSATTPAAVASPTETPQLAPSASPTPTRTATVTPTPTIGPTYVFTNGDFERGTFAWLKFGGELSAVAAPRRGGAAAGAFRSETESTKWAYQPVRIDPAVVYQFEGYVQPDPGVREAYLRISWYASEDGSGTALATDDSLSRVGGGAAAFTSLTTGPRRPPAAARSARLRLILAPKGAGAATVYLDDFSFGPSLATATPPPASTAVAQDEPLEAVEENPGTPMPRPAAALPAVTTNTAQENEVLPMISDPSAANVPLPSTAPDDANTSAGQPEAESVIETILIAGSLFFLTLGGVYLLAKKRVL